MFSACVLEETFCRKYPNLSPIGVRLGDLSEHFWLTFGFLFQGLILGLILGMLLGGAGGRGGVPVASESAESDLRV